MSQGATPSSVSDRPSNQLSPVAWVLVRKLVGSYTNGYDPYHGAGFHLPVVSHWRDWRILAACRLASEELNRFAVVPSIQQHA